MLKNLIKFYGFLKYYYVQKYIFIFKNEIKLQ